MEFDPAMIWGTSFDKFVQVVTNLGLHARVTVNYGSGTPELAAAWVRHANITNHLNLDTGRLAAASVQRVK